MLLAKKLQFEYTNKTPIAKIKQFYNIKIMDLAPSEVQGKFIFKKEIDNIYYKVIYDSVL